MKNFHLLIWALLPLFAISQTTFTRQYPIDGQNLSINDMVRVSDQSFAYITSTFFYLVDQQGAVILQKDLRQGINTNLNTLVTDQAGNFYITGYISTSITDGNMSLFKLDRQGQLIFVRPFLNRSIAHLTMSPAANDHFYITYSIPVVNDYEMIVLLVDNQGNTIWKKTSTTKNQPLFAAGSNANGLLNIVYTSRPDSREMWLQLDGAGKIHEQELALEPAADTLITYSIHSFSDGSFTGVGTLSADKPLTDGVIYQVDKNGLLVWRERINIHRNDIFKHVTALADGYLITGETGQELRKEATFPGDIVLVKTDLQGRLQWRKALGSGKGDFATKVLVADAGHLLIGGRAPYSAYQYGVPTLFRTDRQGNLEAHIPFRAEPVTGFKKLQPLSSAPVQTLRQIVPAENGSCLVGSLFQQPGDDLIYPYVIKVDNAGKELWHRQLTIVPGNLQALTATPDGHYLVLANSGSYHTLVKLATGGQVQWTANIAMNILRDLVPTTDGGCLLVGGEDLSLSNFDLVMVKLGNTGQQQWKKKIGVTSHWEIAWRIKETPEHDYLMAGTIHVAFGLFPHGLAVKIDKEGNRLWQKTYDASKMHGQLADIGFTSDNGYILTGSCGTAYDKKDVWLLRLDKQGGLLWEKTYDLHQLDEGLSLMITGDSILVAGTTGEALCGRIEKYGYLLSVNKDGNRPKVQYFGKAGVQTSIEKIWAQGTDVMIAGNAQEDYGTGYMFFGQAGKGYVEIPPPAEPQAGRALVVYPNPTYSKAFISMKNNFNGPVNIVLYNTTGQQVMVVQRTKTSIELKEEVPLTGLASGMYYFFIQYGNEKSTQTIRVINH